jgi:peptidoglycan L-alanyl-D-glutamate endopeptidase CwlK
VAAKLNAKSVENLKGVDKRLIELAAKAREISPIPFEITEGLRTLERQKYLVATGKSRTLKSYHLRGKAMDFVAKPEGKVSWNLADYKTIVNKAFKPAAKALGLSALITYGVEWKTIVDGPHIQIEN